MTPPLEDQVRAVLAREPLPAPPDTSLFPPTMRPFVRLALDSLARGGSGQHFDHRAVDQLLDELLPAIHEDGPEPGTRPEPSGAEPGPTKSRDLTRIYGELALFLRMLEVEARRSARGTTLPVLDSIERVLCRAMAYLRRLPETPPRKVQTRLREPLLLMLEQYEAQADALRRRIDPVLDVDAGLAVAKPGETVDYPLRALRFSGYLATAGLAHHFAGEQDDADRYAGALHRLWETNPGGCLSPVTDDQIIEMALVWELWLRRGHRDWTRDAAHACVERLALRKVMGLPLPALYQRARVPMENEDLRFVVEAHARGRDQAPAGFVDDASTILPFATFLAQRLESDDLDTLLSWFLAGEDETSRLSRRAVYAESWQPPEEGPGRWYTGELRWSGTCRVFMKELADSWPGGGPRDASPAVRIADAFEAFHQPVPQSPAERWELPVVDRMAWKLWRTPPAMSLLVELVNEQETP